MTIAFILAPMVRAALSTIVLSCLLTACSSTSPDHVAPEQPAGSGQQQLTPTYPAGPYGTRPGAIVQNFAFEGFPTAEARAAGTLVTIHLSDFYNPHADDPNYAPADAASDDRLFPPGSPYGEGTKKPKALMIDAASVWCGPCNDEAKTVLPPKHATYSKCGGQFLLALQDGPTPGIAALPKHLISWGTRYAVDFPHSLEPTSKLEPLFKGSGIPENMMIDTRTMTLVHVVDGEMQPTDWKPFEKIINDDACLASAG